MYTHRFFTLFIAIALVAVVAFTVREAVDTNALVPGVDSATRSYIGWAKAVEAQSHAEANPLDSATRNYGAWAMAMNCQSRADPDQKDLNSATRSYIAWAKYAESGPCH